MITFTSNGSCMASRKDGAAAANLPEKSNSAPCSPRNSGRRRSIVSSPFRDVPKPAPPSRSVPNYLKPTISSRQHTACQYPEVSQPDATSPRPAPPKQLTQPRPSLPYKPTARHYSSEPEASKGTPPPGANGKLVIPLLRKVRSFRMPTETPLPTSPKSKGRFVKAAEGDEERGGGSAQQKERARARSMSMGAIDVAPKKVNQRRTEGKKVAAGVKAMVEKEEGDEEGKAKEEAQAPLVELAARRNKVKALVGAFETVISQQEMEVQHIQHHDEVAAVLKGLIISTVNGDGQPDQHVEKSKAGGEAEKYRCGPHEGSQRMSFNTSEEEGEEDDMHRRERA